MKCEIVTEQDKLCTYKHNIEACSNYNCCHGKTISIKYYEWPSVALVTSMQCACAELYCHLCPVWLCLIFPHYVIYGTVFG